MKMIKNLKFKWYDWIIYGVILIYTLVHLLKLLAIAYDYYILDSSSQVFVSRMNSSTISGQATPADTTTINI